MAVLHGSKYICHSYRLKSKASKNIRPFTTSILRLNDAGRSSIAPKPIIDIKHIRQNPGLYSQNCIDRNYAAQSQSSFEILDLFQRRQNLSQQTRTLREKSNAIQQTFSNKDPKAEESNTQITKDKQSLLQEAREIKAELQKLTNEEDTLSARIDQLAFHLPNLSSDKTPIGPEPEVVTFINPPSPSSPTPEGPPRRSHTEIGAELDLLDFTSAGVTSGWGWYYLINDAALLEQALIQYALSVASERGWTVVSPPSIVYAHIASACGFQPRDQNGEQQIYSLHQPSSSAPSTGQQSKPELSLSGTAEIALAGMKAGQTLNAADLPLRYIGISRCYRAEAGARGLDTKGLYRVHEFSKVELFAWTLPDRLPDDNPLPIATSSSSPSFRTSSSLQHQQQQQQQQQIFNEMLDIQTHILRSLGLHCRVLEMPASDLGASATRKRDIEACFPSRRETRNQGWGEVTSTSMCSDYQTRRLATRLRGTGGSGKLEFPFTVNGTAMAVPRVLAALLENGWDEDRRVVVIPEVLRPWMGGREVVCKKI
ncbi:MAG: hypothetical protein M1825_005853 [Sarcosagium campestre]|nr:MAG: hypothetical protein M1825_005853 [Sarcosagium campestre]